ncbi:hypothetical protein [Paenibacillus tarimensis]|uniref:hypothetical protein n=1 Tax=Paenibacillus tarimensis TaxID=416012 RepID=UPI001F3125F3|nr:hypothetical protein [Paenibacillus tarimensis]MCF2945332.1 hypothetical protein [Paenibacillus tarimensis]
MKRFSGCGILFELQEQRVPSAASPRITSTPCIQVGRYPDLGQPYTPHMPKAVSTDCSAPLQCAYTSH